MRDQLKRKIHEQRIALAELLSAPMGAIAGDLPPIWGDRGALATLLSERFSQIPHCLFLYVLDCNGVQISDNISIGGLLPEHFGRDRSQRPYMQEAMPAWGFLLSDAYLSLRSNRPSLTARQVVSDGSRLLGYLTADFDLRDLPVTSSLYEESWEWLQLKGDPAIRSAVFQQCRVESLMDREMVTACAILRELVCERGVFQAVIHFSSSRATIWTVDDPYRYRILDHESLADPDLCLLYPLHDYPDGAVIERERVSELLDGMRRLRLADDNIYLRSASLNLFNGMISLTFSCDGTHYMPWHEFLDREMSLWLGGAS